MIVSDKEKTGTLLRIRILLGELILVNSLYWFGIVLIMTFNYLFHQEDYPIKDNEILLVFARNVGISILSYLMGSKIGYGKWTPFKDRTFSDNLQKNMQYKYRSKFFARIVKILAIIVLGYGLFFGILGVLLLYGEESTEDLISIFITFDLPAIVFGYKWFNASEYISTTLEKDLDLQKSVNSTLLTPNEIVNVRNQFRNRFFVIHPSKFRWVIIILFALLLNISSLVFTLTSPLYIGAIVISTLIALFTWKRLSPRITQSLVINTLKIWNARVIWENNPQGPKPSLSIFRKIFAYLYGINLSLDNRYYLEAKPTNLDLNSIWQLFRERNLEFILACMATVFLSLLLSGYNDTIQGHSGECKDSDFLIIVNILYLLIFSPILVSWLIPVIWTIQDLNIKMIDKRQTISSLANNIRKSQIERLLGFSGFLAGVAFFVELFEKLPCMSITDGDRPNQAILIFEAVVFLLYFLFLYAGVAYIISIFYTRNSHEQIVNKFRNDLAQILPIGSTLARKVTAEEEQIFDDI